MPSSKSRHQDFELNPAPTRINHNQLIAYSLAIFLLTIAIFLFIFFTDLNLQPGNTLLQSSATLGAILLLFPLFFSVVKRSGLTKQPTRWFAFHVFASMIGFIFISIHVSAGNIFSIPGIMYLILILIIYQGVFSRAYISKKFSNQFGSREHSFYISKSRKDLLRQLIVDKKRVLQKLDTNADEALFSPNLQHAFRHPFLTLKYVALTSRESQIVGARRKAGKILSLWRPLHILMAILFILGAIIHTITVLFFAGYVAGDDIIYWWHIASWGD